MLVAELSKGTCAIVSEGFGYRIIRISNKKTLSLVKLDGTNYWGIQQQLISRMSKYLRVSYEKCSQEFEADTKNAEVLFYFKTFKEFFQKHPEELI